MWPFFGEIRVSGMPRVICTTQIVAYRWGAAGERVVPLDIDGVVVVRRVRRPVSSCSKGGGPFSSSCIRVRGRPISRSILPLFPLVRSLPRRLAHEVAR